MLPIPEKLAGAVRFAVHTAPDRRGRRRLTRFGVSAMRTLLLFSVGYVILFPLFYMVSNALRPQAQLLDPSVVWVPKSITFQNFALAIEAMRFVPAALFTLRVQVLSALIEVFTCAVAAYGCARFSFLEKRLVYGRVFLTILVPPQMIIMSTYLGFAHFDVLGVLGLIGQLLGADIRPSLIDTGWTFWLPSIFGAGLRSGLLIYIYVQFFKGLPRELEEAAWIDGANPLRTFLKIILPSSSVVILTVSIFSVIWHWNDYYLSTMYFGSKFPLSIALVQMKSSLNAIGYAVNTNILTGINMAGCILLILPVFVLYLFLQRFFIRGIERVGIVG